MTRTFDNRDFSEMEKYDAARVEALQRALDKQQRLNETLAQVVKTQQSVITEQANALTKALYEVETLRRDLEDTRKILGGAIAEVGGIL